MRTARERRAELLPELRNGRLRQGWGYDSSQDLRLIQAEIEHGGKWWERLNDEEKSALPNLRMLSAAEDSVHLGDYILLPNLPEDGTFLVAEVNGDYYFDMLNEEDFGHVLPVSLIVAQGINRYAEIVDARIRATLRTPMRMWNVDAYGDAIEQLVEQYRRGGRDFTTPTTGEGRLQSAWDLALPHASLQLQERLGRELDARFQAAEWEEAIVLVLRSLYPGADIRWIAGPQESGADVIVQLPNHFGDIPWLIVVQVKNYAGEIGPAVLTQLRNAHTRYSTEGKILLLVVMTTAEKLSSGVSDSAHALEEELATPVKFVLRTEMMATLSDGLIARMNQLHQERV